MDICLLLTEVLPLQLPTLDVPGWFPPYLVAEPSSCFTEGFLSEEFWEYLRIKRNPPITWRSMVVFRYLCATYVCSLASVSNHCGCLLTSLSRPPFVNLMPKSTRSYELYERADDVEHLNFNLIVAFDALNLFAVITLSAIFLTAYFSSQIRRVSTWYLYIFSWAVFSLGYLLILGHQTNSQPGHGICLVQSMFIYATPAL